MLHFQHSVVTDIGLQFVLIILREGCSYSVQHTSVFNGTTSQFTCLFMLTRDILNLCKQRLISFNKKSGSLLCFDLPVVISSNIKKGNPVSLAGMHFTSSTPKSEVLRSSCQQVYSLVFSPSHMCQVLSRTT